MCSVSARDRHDRGLGATDLDRAGDGDRFADVDADPRPPGQRPRAAQPDGHERRPRHEREPRSAAVPAVLPLRFRCPLREHPEQRAAAEQAARFRDRRPVSSAALHRKRVQRAEHGSDWPVAEELRLRHVVDLAPRRDAEDERIPDRVVVRNEDRRPARRDPLGTDDLDPVEPPDELAETDRVQELVRVHARLPGRARRSCASRSARIRNAASQKAR